MDEQFSAGMNIALILSVADVRKDKGMASRLKKPIWKNHPCNFRYLGTIIVNIVAIEVIVQIDLF